MKIANVIAKSSEQVNSLKLKISISAGFVVVFFEIMLSCRLHWNIQISIPFCSSNGYSKMKKKKKKKKKKKEKKKKKKKEKKKKRKKKSPGA